MLSAREASGLIKLAAKQIGIEYVRFYPNYNYGYLPKLWNLSSYSCHYIHYQLEKLNSILGQLDLGITFRIHRFDGIISLIAERTKPQGTDYDDIPF